MKDEAVPLHAPGLRGMISPPLCGSIWEYVIFRTDMQNQNTRVDSLPNLIKRYSFECFPILRLLLFPSLRSYNTRLLSSAPHQQGPLATSLLLSTVLDGFLRVPQHAQYTQNFSDADHLSFTSFFLES